METIAKIRAEIEQRIKYQKNIVERYNGDNTFGKGSLDALQGILAFLDTLESEKPMNPVDLEKDAVSYCFDNGVNLSPRQAEDFARHFYELGRNAK